MLAEYLDLLEVFVALTVAICAPIKVLYFQANFTFGLALDALTLAVFCMQVKSTGWPARKYMWLLWAMPWTSVFRAAPAAVLLTKMVIVPRIFRIRTFLERFDNLHPVFYRIIFAACLLPVIIHAVACGWIALGSGSAGHDPNPVNEYIKGFYWTISTLTTVGYGDISARTNTQMLFAALSEVIGVAFFGYVLSNIASVLSRLDSAREHHLNTLDQVESFIRNNDLPADFRSKIRAYYKYLWQHHRGADDQSILNSLPRLLRSEAAFFMNKDIVYKVSFLKNAPKDLIEDVVCCLKSMIATPTEHLFYHGEVGDTMYFIHRGEIEILDANNQLLVTLREGAFFGEMALLNAAPRSASAQAQSYCDLFVLSKNDFDRVLTKHPQFREHIEQTVHSRTRKVA